MPGRVRVDGFFQEGCAVTGSTARVRILKFTRKLPCRTFDHSDY